MNIQPTITLNVPRPISQWNALERFSAAMQSIKSHQEDMEDNEYPWIIEQRLAEAVGSALIALNQMPAELKALFEPELTRIVAVTL